MSKLHMGGRPWVLFEVDNPQHREWFAEFVKTKTWGKCPVRFEIDGEPGSIETIKRMLLEYYTMKEFSVAKKQRKVQVTA